MNTYKLRQILLAILFPFFLISCTETFEDKISQDEINELNQDDGVLEKIDSLTADKDLLIFLKNQNDFKISQVEKLGNNYVFDRAFLLTEKVLKEQVSIISNSKNAHYVRNSRYNDLRPPGNTQKITLTIYLDQAMSSGPGIFSFYAPSVLATITNYNQISNFLFDLTLTQNVYNAGKSNQFPSSADGILVMSDSNDPEVNLPSNIAGLGEFPFNGSFGKKVWINTDFNTQGTLNTEQRTALVAHELGHTLGFKHTNENPSLTLDSRVPGTPTTDFYSVMNTGDPYRTYGLGPFTAADKLAFHTIYKQNRALTPIYTYKQNSPERYYYSASWNAIGLPNTSFPYYRPLGLIATSQISGTVPLYYYINSQTGAYYYDVNQISISGWQYLGIAGYVYTVSSSGKIPIKRYFRDGIHVYVEPFSDFAYNSNPNYVYIGIAFYLDNV